jgi:Exopolyphosphatase-related proteins
MQQWQNIWQKIESAETINIFRHVNPDPDAYGSQFALARFIKDNFPDKQVFCYGELISRLAYLYEDCKDLLKDDIITADLTIIVDTANKERIDGLVITELANVIKIDHHPNHDHYAKTEYVDAQMPATCAILLNAFLHLEQTAGILLSKTVLTKLYAGIIGDTGNFSYGVGLNQLFFNNIGIVFERIDTKAVLERFYKKTLTEIQFKGLLASKINYNNKFAFIDFSSELIDEYDVTVDFATSLVNIMSEVNDVEVWASFCEDIPNGIIRCSLRSRYLPIADIARRFGGGGHPNAAGIRVKTWTEVTQIKNAIKNLLENS